VSLSPKDVEDKELAWKRAGKGNGLRWLILREIVAGVAYHPMPLEKIQDFLLMLRGVSWNTSRTMLKELERQGSVEVIKEKDMHLYRTTKLGVNIFLRKRTLIPVRIVQAALTTMNVGVVEVQENEKAGV